MKRHRHEGAQVDPEYPLYECHKQVRAIRIGSVDVLPAPYGSQLVPADPAFPTIDVSAEWIAKHEPVAGGFFVVYDGGYTSFSPAEAFESGYTNVDGYVEPDPAVAEAAPAVEPTVDQPAATAEDSGIPADIIGSEVTPVPPLPEDVPTEPTGVEYPGGVEECAIEAPDFNAETAEQLEAKQPGDELPAFTASEDPTEPVIAPAAVVETFAPVPAPIAPDSGTATASFETQPADSGTPAFTQSPVDLADLAGADD